MKKKSLVDELIEINDDDKNIIKTFYIKDILCPDVFYTISKNEYKMIDTVRDKLLKIADAFIDYLGVDFFIYDVILTGSLANYNWSEYSDVDLHILLNFDDITNDKSIKFKEIIEQFFKSKKNNWNNIHNIKIKNYDVELYVQDLNEVHHSSGVYSILNDKWLIKPVYGEKGIDDDIILNKSDEYMEIIDDLIQKFESGEDIIDEINNTLIKLKKFRQSGLDGDGEFSYENLAFKLLRRNGYIGKLIKLKRDFIDRKLSVAQ